MGPDGRFRPELRVDVLVLSEEVSFQQEGPLLLVLRNENGLAVLIVPRPSGPAAHLSDLQDGDHRSADIGIEPPDVAHDYRSSWEVDARG